MSSTIDFERTSAMEISRQTHSILKSVRPENIFRFPQGILGFEDVKEYVFLFNDKIEPFMFMQSLERSHLCFVSIGTFLIKPDYNLVLPEDNVRFLELERPTDAMILSLVTVRKNVEDITANLLSPIVVNMRNSRAQQVIIENSQNPVRYRIWENIDDAMLRFRAG
ncbi:MAG: hypothetical protein A2X49_13780 [Lentisphaerae bacterium GWF2_52_8]|nr:MAG: hypothetical protein A2X49_13780 [Lentisphaerae bacterium GWF2_52_8]